MTAGVDTAPIGNCWLTRSEVAERLRVPVKTLAQWAHQSKGPRYAVFGRHARYRMSDVIDWETAQFRDGAA
jgi:excisionase family DNA binding protein